MHLSVKENDKVHFYEKYIDYECHFNIKIIYQHTKTSMLTFVLSPLKI